MKTLLNILKEKNLTITFAESCTGGLLSASLVNESGSSEVFKEAFVTYSNEAKVKHLGVSETTLNNFGAVSKETAYEMAEGVRKVTKADIGVSITGIAGPTGGTIDKPVGLVYIGVSYDETKVFRHLFTGSRLEVREESVEKAMKHIMEMVTK